MAAGRPLRSIRTEQVGNMEKIIDEGFVISEMNYWRTPSIGISVFVDDKDEESLFIGSRNIEKNLPVNMDTMFCIASCSKAMTATLIGCLVSEGLLDFDRPVTEYAPECQLWDPVASSMFTLRDMLCHRTGFGAHDAIWPCRDGRQAMAERLKYIEPAGMFRQKVLYSNVIYAMAGYVAEAVTGTPWDKLMAEYLFKPLGMTRTNCSANILKEDRNHADPYYMIDGQPKKVPIWNVDQCGPAASVNSTHRDMIRWLRFNCGRGVTQSGKRLLAREIFDEIHAPQMPYVDGGTVYGDYYWADAYCMGWRKGSYKGRPYQKHSGKIEGYSTFQMYLPDERIGLFISANMHSPTEPLFMTLTYTILDRILGEPQENWAARFRDNKQQAPLELYDDCKIDIAGQRLAESAKDRPLPWDIAGTAGLYVNPGYGNISIDKDEGDDLKLTYRDQTLPVRHWGENQFYMDGVKADVLEMRVPVIFNTGADGNVDRVEIGYDRTVRNVLFVKV